MLLIPTPVALKICRYRSLHPPIHGNAIMWQFTVRVVRKNSEKTNDNTVQGFLDFLAKRALPSNSLWRPKITRENPSKLPEFGWEFSGLIEFTKTGGRQSPELIAKERRLILDRL